MLISTAKHKRIVAEKDAEIAGLMKRLDSTQWFLGHQQTEIDKLQKRLAPFTKTRERDERGRFLPLRRPIDDVLYALEVFR